MSPAFTVIWRFTLESLKRAVPQQQYFHLKIRLKIEKVFNQWPLLSKF